MSYLQAGKFMEGECSVLNKTIGSAILVPIVP
jgi:hypothetical protein